MSDQVLRSRLLRLAHRKPELRPVLLPLLKTAAYRPNDWSEPLDPPRYFMTRNKMYLWWFCALEEVSSGRASGPLFQGVSVSWKDGEPAPKKGLGVEQRDMADLNSNFTELQRSDVPPAALVLLRAR